MDELDILKKDWNSDKSSYREYTDSEIAPMLHKKSSSIVKTLFYISIAELFLWIIISALPYFLSDDMRDRMEKSYENPLFITLTVIGFVVIFAFIYLLFKSYRSISTTDNTKKLMESILKTRKVIKYYVIYNLAMVFVSIPLSLYFEFNENIEFHDQVAAFNPKQMVVMAGIIVVMMVVFFVLLLLFYRLIYGVLLKRLNRNYKELKRLEV
ncbi:hypothetical protein [Winogradskyella ursingii]|uniref:hypothetical protein n=1 Tax=Winogradskyella ursingii TaxID=2686079 RepID=UPI0015CD1462|nr:hypothetical protein [Winogradskyella ursingii]